MTEESIKEITDEMLEILLKKNEDYGGASFDLGLNGNMVHLWDKVSRYRNLINCSQNEPNFEGLEDTLKDIIGYAIIGLHIINDKSIQNKVCGDFKFNENE
ncbi:MAG TPA: nucleotide modification associated domain-containing protein [Macellibacteroides fermentans]|uniref:nucleotide modification associated domain-containing protein n=1 Tax=Macellibacteroides fermentans TaxID=879969 RepID=UPI002BB924ED|nr:nucleotide modification associated domain-containing protein [Macellibacteroides fermentans]